MPLSDWLFSFDDHCENFVKQHWGEFQEDIVLMMEKNGPFLVGMYFLEKSVFDQKYNEYLSRTWFRNN